MSSTSKDETVLHGIAASPGVASGPAFIFLKKDLEIPSYQVSRCKREEEVARFEQALLETRKEISAIRAEVEERLGEDESRIFDAHQLVLEDRALIEETINEVDQTGFNIEYCFHQVASRYIEAFSNIDDEYLRERVNDIRDVSRRLLHKLMGRSDFAISDFADQKVIVSDDLSPSDTANLDRNKVLAIVTDQGSRTSHSVIMARSIQVPAVVGLHDLTRTIEYDQIVLVDGYEGLVILNPSEDTLHRYGRIQVERRKIQHLFEKEAGLPAETRDGAQLKLFINVEGFEDADELTRAGCEGVGLFRTEGIFLRDDRFPDEEEQFEAYRRIVSLFPDHPVIIRTLDLGGDKASSNSPFESDETNPFMGFRAIRFCLKHPDIFKMQLRAILRAGACGRVKVMFPMISGIEEFLTARDLLEECKQELEREGCAYDPDIAVGSMIEIPSAAYVADHLAEQCDFFSIGTNDLIQYMLAVDRVNDRIAHLYEPNHPAVLRTIQHVIDAGHKRKIPVGICGEMAGDPVYAALLFGMGANEISLTPAVAPEIKYAIRHMTMAEARNLAANVLRSCRASDTADLLRDFYRDVLAVELRPN